MTTTPKTRVLVTGGLGYIGSHVVLALLETGKYDPIILDNCHNAQPTAPGICANIASTTLGHPVSPPPFHQGDIRDVESLRNIFKQYEKDGGIWGVIHLAALKAVGESAKKPIAYYDVNIGGSIALLKVMEEFGTRQIVFSSSATVYGAPEIIPIPETSAVIPESPYGQTKAVVEKLIEVTAKASLDTPEPIKAISVRYFNPAGAHPSGLLGEEPVGRPNNLLPLLAQMATGRIPLELQVFGTDYDTRDGTCIRDYIHILDLAYGHVLALDSLLKQDNQDVYRIYNLGRGVGMTVLEMVHAMEKVSGRELPYEVKPRRAGDVTNLTADPTRAEKELGFKATRGLDEMCQDLWRFQALNDEKHGGKR